MNNFSERIIKSFAKRDRYGNIVDDDEDFNIKISDEEYGEIKTDLLRDKNSSKFYTALSKALQKYSTISRLTADTSFMNQYRNTQGQDSYNKLLNRAKQLSAAKAIADKNKEDDARKSARNIKMLGLIGDTFTSTMEEPAKGFFEGLFNILKESKMNALKLKELVDDDTGLDVSKDLEDITGKSIDKVTEETTKEKQEPQSDEAKNKSNNIEKQKSDKSTKSTSSSNKEFLNKMLEKGGKITDEDKEELKNIKDQKFISDFRKVHPRIANELYGEVDKKNFSERISFAFHNFSSLEDAIKEKYSDSSKIKSLRFPTNGTNGSLRGSVKAAVVIIDEGQGDEGVDVYMCDQSNHKIRKISIPDEIYEGSDSDLDKWAVDKANWYWDDRGGLD